MVSKRRKEGKGGRIAPLRGQTCPACYSSGTPSWATKRRYYHGKSYEEPTHLGPERPEPRGFKSLPPREELGKLLVPNMNLKLKLSEWEGFPSLHIRLDERGEGLELPAFNVDFKDINMGMAFRDKRQRAPNPGWTM